MAISMLRRKVSGVQWPCTCMDVQCGKNKGQESRDLGSKQLRDLA